MNELPFFIPLLFVFATGLALYIYFRAFRGSFSVMGWMSAWLLVQAFLGFSGFYDQTGKVMPRFLFLVLPPLVFIILIFSIKVRSRTAYPTDVKWFVLFHVIRIPIELVLFWLFVYRYLPKEMTFEGRNVDLLAGLSAPLIYYFGFVKKRLTSRIIITWNIISLGLLLNIVVIAILSLPTPFQKFGFEQPNKALLHFPYVWLPCGLVPMVLYAHLITIQHFLVGGHSIFRKTKHYTEI